MPYAALDPDALARVPLNSFDHSESDDLFEKCGRFHAYVEQLRSVGVYQVQYRIELLGALDARITVKDAFTGEPREMICYDSNSYLGLHLDPRVREAAKRAVDELGYGTPSAQVLGGTNPYLVELEEKLAALHGRDETLIYPSGYQANIGILTGLMREEDLVVMDRVSHASLHDGARYARCQVARYPYRDMQALDDVLSERRSEAKGALIVSDGLFSMHGGLANLPEMRRLADKHNARLMIDDAHSLGIIGDTGKGLEEHFGMEGASDVMMGTFSKAPGAAGGYVCGDAAMIDYLRYMSRGALFTATLPAPTCAGLIAALEIMHSEPEHRLKLWANSRRMHEGLMEAGLALPPLESPILSVQVGDEKWLPLLAFALYKEGIKCGIARYPAVPHGESILRLTMNARHEIADIDRTIEVLSALWTDLGISEARLAG